MNSISNLFQNLRLTKTSNSIDGFKTKIDSNDKINKSLNIFREITLEEVAMHDDYYDCWVIIYDRVYNVTSFLSSHPGGEDIIMDYAGRDATFGFRGTGHSRDAIEMMKDYLIGELPEHERIIRKTQGNIILTDIPE